MTRGPSRVWVGARLEASLSRAAEGDDVRGLAPRLYHVADSGHGSIFDFNRQYKALNKNQWCVS